MPCSSLFHQVMQRMITSEVYLVMKRKSKIKNVQAVEKALLSSLATGRAVSTNCFKKASRDYTESTLNSMTLEKTWQDLTIRSIKRLS